MAPSLAGFVSFIANVMGISTSVLPANAPVIGLVYNLSINTVNAALTGIPNADPAQPSIYAIAVYNLAGDLLVNYAQDTPPSTYFADLRTAFGCNSFVGGIINSTSDNDTSQSMTLPEAFNNLTIGNLQTLKTPWGRQYLGIAQAYGSLWGLS